MAHVQSRRGNVNPREDGEELLRRLEAGILQEGTNALHMNDAGAENAISSAK